MTLKEEEDFIDFLELSSLFDFDLSLRFFKGDWDLLFDFSAFLVLWGADALLEYICIYFIAYLISQSGISRFVNKFLLWLVKVTK